MGHFRELQRPENSALKIFDQSVVCDACDAALLQKATCDAALLQKAARAAF